MDPRDRTSQIARYEEIRNRHLRVRGITPSPAETDEDEYGLFERLNIVSPKARERVYDQVAGAPEFIGDTFNAIRKVAPEVMRRVREDPMGSIAAVPGIAKDVASGVLSDIGQTLTNPRAAVEERGLLPALDLVDVATLGMGGVGALTRRGVGAGIRGVTKEGVGQGLRGLARSQVDDILDTGAIRTASALGPRATDDVLAQTRQLADEALSGVTERSVIEAAPGAARRAHIPGVDQIRTPRAAREGLMDAYESLGSSVQKKAWLEGRYKKASAQAKRAKTNLDPKDLDDLYQPMVKAIDEEIAEATQRLGASASEYQAVSMWHTAATEAAKRGPAARAAAISAMRHFGQADDPIKAVQVAVEAGYDPITMYRALNPADSAFAMEAARLSDDPILRAAGQAVDLNPRAAAAGRTAKSDTELIASMFAPDPQTLMAQGGEIGFFGRFIFDPEYAIPGLMQVLGAPARLKNLKQARMTSRLEPLAKGLSKREKAALTSRIAPYLRGEHGDVGQLIASGSLASAVGERGAHVITEIHKMGGELLEELSTLPARMRETAWNNGIDLGAREYEAFATAIKSAENVIADVGTNPAEALRRMLAWAAKDNMPKTPGQVAESLMPPDVIRNVGKSIYVKALGGTEDILDSGFDIFHVMEMYTNSILRKSHLDPAMLQLYHMRKAGPWAGQPLKAEVVTKLEDYLIGRASTIDKTVQGIFARAANSKAARAIGIKSLDERFATKMSITLTSQFYRGVLGINASAALQNTTQVLNTMAEAGVMPTMKAIGTTLSKKGEFRAAIRDLNVTSEVKHLAEVADGLSDVSWGGSWMKSVDHKLFYMFEKAELFNRSVSFHAGANAHRARLLKQGRSLSDPASVKEMITEGLRTVRETQFLYDEVSRNPTFRSIPGRFFGILGSFPIKQGQFLLGGPTANMEAKLMGVMNRRTARYLALTTMASIITERGMGVELQALQKGSVGLPGLGNMSVPAGLEPMMSVEMAGPVLATPPVDVFVTAQALLGSMFDYENNPNGFSEAANAFLEAIASIVPASVQIRELFQVIANSSEGVKVEKRSLRAKGSGGVRAHWPLLDDMFDTQAALQGEPVAGSSARSGDVIRTTTPGSEILDALGIRNVAERDADNRSREALARDQNRKSTVAIVSERVNTLIEMGEYEKAQALAKANGLNATQIRNARAARYRGQKTKRLDSIDTGRMPKDEALQLANDAREERRKILENTWSRLRASRAMRRQQR